jgi:hypothetical protein
MNLHEDPDSYQPRTLVPGGSDTKRKLHADVNLARHLDNLGEIHDLLGSFLQICDGEDLEAGIVDLDKSG